MCFLLFVKCLVCQEIEVILYELTEHKYHKTNLHLTNIVRSVFDYV